MSTLRERELLKAVYKKSKEWASKVDKMSDTQIIAIFMRMKRQGKV